jgi:DnaJ-class molecular chaperone
MAFQKCPICMGTAEIYSPTETTLKIKCKACHGAGIIDEFTGLPPIDKSQAPKGEYEFKKIIKNDINK